jgi:hypothetical protein
MCPFVVVVITTGVETSVSSNEKHARFFKKKKHRY